MALEKRRNRNYYYRKMRRGAHVRSVYVGAGELSRLMLLLDESRALEEGLKRALAQKEREEFAAQDAIIERACSMIETLTNAALLAEGFHTHKRQWRRKRS